MKRLMIGATLAIGLTCIGTAAIAHTDEQVVELDNGFAVLAIVAHSPAEFARAQREAKMMEAQRLLGLGPLTIVARAIDESPQTVATPAMNEGAVASVPSR
ncbi:hypothetical protein [Rhodanobacter sp. C01]|uniref:hypothetical protein n=1 Tax=Rhodanobacter sp. C01 TaxID=1945856 RepID=UPI001115684B|nr:hypothetical protein [Rhodanobacter sp. C01]